MKRKIYWGVVVAIVTACFVIGTYAPAPVEGSGVAPAAINQVQSAGAALAFERAINFTGGGCVDNAGAMRTDCTIVGGYNTVDNAGVGLTQRTTLNFTGSGVTCVDNGGATRTDCTVPGAPATPTGNSVTSVTPVTVQANSTMDQKLIELSFSAGYFNTSLQAFLFTGAGVYSTQAAQTPTLTFKIKLCTVSGCGAGTVVTLVNIVTTATIAAVTNNNWFVSTTGITATTGAAGNLEIHGPVTVDLGAAITTADSVFGDTNTAVSGNIDLTAALFVDFTVAFSTQPGATFNAATQRLAMVAPQVASPPAQFGTFAAQPACNATNNNLLYLFTNSAYSASLCNGAAWGYFRNGIQLTPPPSAGWTMNNAGACAAVDTTNGYRYLSCPATGGTTNSMRWESRTAPATPYTVTGHILHDSADADGGFSFFALVFGDGTGKLVTMEIGTAPNIGTSVQGWQIFTGNWTNATTFGSTHLTWPSGANAPSPSITGSAVQEPSCFQIKDDGAANLTFLISSDCNHYRLFDTWSRTAIFAAGPTLIGWGLNPINNATTGALISWTAQ